MNLFALNNTLALLKDDLIPLNCSKSKFMFSGTTAQCSKPAGICAKCGDTELERVEEHKYLIVDSMVDLDSALTFKANTCNSVAFGRGTTLSSWKRSLYVVFLYEDHEALFTDGSKDGERASGAVYSILES